MKKKTLREILVEEYLDRIVEDHHMEYCVYGYVVHCFELSDGDE